VCVTLCVYVPVSVRALARVNACVTSYVYACNTVYVRVSV